MAFFGQIMTRICLSIFADNLWDMILLVLDVMVTGRKVTEPEIQVVQSLVQPFLGEE